MALPSIYQTLPQIAVVFTSPSWMRLFALGLLMTTLFVVHRVIAS
jgi:hypothetical protein